MKRDESIGKLFCVMLKCVLLINSILYCQSVSANETASVTEKNNLYAAPFHVRLAFAKKVYKKQLLNFTLHIINTSDHDIYIYDPIYMVEVINDIRTLKGKPINTYGRRSTDIGIQKEHFVLLKAGQSREIAVKWNKHWEVPEIGTYRVRFAYSNRYALSIAKEKKWIFDSWQGDVLSNTFLLKFQKNTVTVLGEWHIQKPIISLSALKAGYRLIKSHNLSGNLPIELSLNLYAINMNIRRRIERLEDLQGMVRINTEKKALEYVQLITSINSHFLFSSSPLFEVKTPIFDVGESYGNLNGVILDGKKSLLSPQVKRIRGGYLIQRDLSTYPDPITKKSKILRVREIVSEYGNYQRKIVSVLLIGDLRGVPGVYLPYY